ncbi:MAG: FkbM family methyltransferase [Kordiimonadaceae bacterium]|nr:FkbM family methyltransferase [Kordiimonadaceae bacterium]
MKITNVTPEIDIHDYQYRPPRYVCELDGKIIKFVTSTENAKLRAETIMSSEPETIDWINSFTEGEILYDIGANVGSYSLYAAIMKDVNVVAFEPEAHTFALLNYNIFLNAVSDKLTAYNIAISDEEAMTNLYLNFFGAGTSCSSVSEPVSNYDAFNEKGLETLEPKYVQGVFSASLDHLVYDKGLTAPHHIKIDVDGFEHKVIAGADRLLKSGTVKTLLVEINKFMQEHRDIVSRLTAEGYEVQDIGTANLIFRRSVKP